MNKTEMKELKEETAHLDIRLGNIEGYFQNFDTTLNNHMNDYKDEQGRIRDKVDALALEVAKLQGSEGIAIVLVKWVVVPLIALLAGLVGVKVIWPGAF